MQHSVKKISLKILFFIACMPITNLGTYCTAQESLRFTSLLDDCLLIWDESCALFSCDNSHSWLTIHDLLVGRLTRLNKEIAKLEKESNDSQTVLISDLEYLISILVQIEQEYMQRQEAPEQDDSILMLSRSIRKKISELI